MLLFRTCRGSSICLICIARRLGYLTGFGSYLLQYHRIDLGNNADQKVVFSASSKVSICIEYVYVAIKGVSLNCRVYDAQITKCKLILILLEFFRNQQKCS